MTTYKEIEQQKYSVWVGGVEVNDYYLNLDQAENLADEYIIDGYDDVLIDKLPTITTISTSNTNKTS